MIITDYLYSYISRLVFGNFRFNLNLDQYSELTTSYILNWFKICMYVYASGCHCHDAARHSLSVNSRPLQMPSLAQTQADSEPTLPYLFIVININRRLIFSYSCILPLIPFLFTI